MSFELDVSSYEKIEKLFINYNLKNDFKFRMIKGLNVLHFGYLWGACKEAQKILEKNQECKDLFELIMKIYSKRRKNHQANFLLLQCYENALRSTLAVKIANLYNELEDNWFRFGNNDVFNFALKNLLKKVKNRCQKIDDYKNTWQIFDNFCLIDLEEILIDHWKEFAYIFKDKKIYKNQILPSFGTKEHLKTKLSQIRKARNEIFHNKPTKIKFKKDLEILLLRLGYNLEDAIDIGNIKEAIVLKFNYNNIGN
ncbi:hypothetical protein [Campylobacter peloridis]|uniref:hypothetical protein n=1 Tax=Campylobacter peloridis TaxID=488546 RepID=UPI001C730F66|nr:hypothetical protein [Campylobacter peloridis]MBX1885438.1 hypothetical protein [Campylobacter peloridis]